MWLDHECGAGWRNWGNRSDRPQSGISQMLRLHEQWVSFPEFFTTLFFSFLHSSESSEVLGISFRPHMEAGPHVTSGWCLNPQFLDVNIKWGRPQWWCSYDLFHISWMAWCCLAGLPHSATTELWSLHALVLWPRLSADSFWLASCYSLPSQGHLILWPLIACWGNNSILPCSEELEERLFIPWKGEMQGV